jgi:hypothetical protein
MLNQEKLKEFVSYDQSTGVFTRRISRGQNQFGAKFARWKAGTVMGYINTQGYVRISIFGKIHQGHRLAWLYMTGEWPKDQIDHINHDRSDNRFSNLREATNSVNGKNISLPRTNSSGVIGVHRHSHNDCWVAQIVVDGKARHLGCFKNVEAAALARQNAEIQHGFHVNHGLVDR